MANFVERFGKVKSIEIKTAAKTGKDFLRLAIDAGKFTVYASVFKDELVAMLRDAPVGERVWVKGPMDANTVEVNGESKTYKNLVAQFARLGEKPAKAATTETTETTSDEAVIVDEVETAFA